MLRFIAFILFLFPLTALAQNCAPGILKGELLQRNEADQAARKRLSAEPQSKDALDQALQIDRDNTAYLRKMLADCGWPKRSEIGEQAAKSAWRMTQHADMDPQYQVLAAQQLKYAVLGGEAEAWDLAVLVDRNRRLTNQLQVYGMQSMTLPDKTIRFYDIVTPSQLDARRKEIGLTSFYCWTLQLSRQSKGASLEWPTGVLFAPQDCPEAK